MPAVSPGDLGEWVPAVRGGPGERIANTGPPLIAEERERIFEDFYGGDPSYNRRVDDAGLGLARETALAHGGELRVDTERPGDGVPALSLDAAS